MQNSEAEISDVRRGKLETDNDSEVDTQAYIHVLVDTKSILQVVRVK